MPRLLRMDQSLVQWLEASKAEQESWNPRSMIFRPAAHSFHDLFEKALIDAEQHVQIFVRRLSILLAQLTSSQGQEIWDATVAILKLDIEGREIKDMVLLEKVQTDLEIDSMVCGSGLDVELC